MPNLRNVYLTLFLLVAASLAFAMEAKADPVQFTLTQTTFDLGANSFSLSGFFTNTGSVTFTANRFDVLFTPFLAPSEIRAIPFSSPDCCNYTQAVPGMSSSPVLPMLEFILTGSPVMGPGLYTGSLTFTGVAGSNLNVTTAPVQFTVNVTDPVPEPGTIVLFGTGLMAVATAVRRRMIADRTMAGG